MIKGENAKRFFIFLGGMLFGAGLLGLIIGLGIGSTKVDVYSLAYMLAGFLTTLYGVKRA